MMLWITNMWKTFTKKIIKFFEKYFKTSKWRFTMTINRISACYKSVNFPPIYLLIQSNSVSSPSWVFFFFLFSWGETHLMSHEGEVSMVHSGLYDHSICLVVEHGHHPQRKFQWAVTALSCLPQPLGSVGTTSLYSVPWSCLFWIQS